MARPYHIAKRLGRGVYHLPDLPGSVNRPNRSAAGYSATAHRQGLRLARPLKLEGEALALAVRGTLDVLGAARFDLIRAPDGMRWRLRPGRVKLRLKQIQRSRPKGRLP